MLNLFDKTKRYYKKYNDNKLLKKYGKVEHQNKHIKILCIADTHGYLKYDKMREKIEKHKDDNYDICCLLGDISYDDIEIILKYIPKEKIIAVLGNHDDFNILKHFELKDINGKVVEINGIKIAGIHGAYRYKTKDFPSFTQVESVGFAEKIEKADILISHSGPYYKNNANIIHNGLLGISYYLFKNKVPYNIHGHLHVSETKTLINGTKDICVFEVELIEL